MDNAPLIPPTYPEPQLPRARSSANPGTAATPSPARQSWGVIISIAIIVLMIIIGAFYAWGKRVAEERAYTAPSSLP